mgnify:CR=1 FL=1
MKTTTIAAAKAEARAAGFTRAQQGDEWIDLDALWPGVDEPAMFIQGELGACILTLAFDSPQSVGLLHLIARLGRATPWPVGT